MSSTAATNAVRRRTRAARWSVALAAVAACHGLTAATIDELAWISGCWAVEGAEPGSGEQWTAPAGGTMLGTNRAIRDGRTVAHEFLQIRETDDGSLVYIAAPEGQTETEFELLSSGLNLVAFENSWYEFPRRIIYRLEGDDRLVARIEGEVDGEFQAVDFPMRRVPCPGAAAD